MSALAKAIELACEGFRVFPCLATKAPACPGGFKAATAHIVEVGALWRSYPGDLIGLATGEASGFDVLDLDLKADGSPDGAAWWMANHARLPATFACLTRSGGLHLWFRHASGMRNSASKIAPGVDVRATGGYIIFWPAAGCEVIQRVAPADWPGWLLEAVTRPQQSMARGYAPHRLVGAPETPGGDASRSYALAAIRSGVRRIAEAPEGQRNTALNRECFSLARFTAKGTVTSAELARAMVIAGLGAGLTVAEAGSFGLAKGAERTFLRVDGAKANYSAVAGVEWFERQARLLDNGEHVAALIAWEPPAKADGSPEVIAGLLEGIAIGSPAGPYSKRLSGDLRSIRGLFERFGIAAGMQARMLRTLTEAHGVAVGSYRGGDRKPADGLRTADGRPADAPWLDLSAVTTPQAETRVIN